MAENFVNVTEGSGKKLHTWNRTIGANDVHDEAVYLGEQPLAEYRVQGGGTSLGTAASHNLQVMAGASLHVYVRRIRVYQSVLVTTAALAVFDLIRLTTAGTGGTSVTPRPLDTGDAASGATGMTLPTAKGTEGVVIETQLGYLVQTLGASLGVPQATLLADFDFRGPRQKSLRIPAGTANGIAVKNVNANAGASVVVVAEIVEANF